MDNFEELMKQEGISPLNKKTKINKKNPDNISKKNNKKNNKKKLKNNSINKSNDNKENVSFSKLLELYQPNDDSITINKMQNKVIFNKNFSNINEEEIEHCIDLHGLTIEEAEEKVNQELIFCVRQKFNNILVITGKGIHSKKRAKNTGEIIKIKIESLLLNKNNIIRKIEYAPQNIGGEGAYIVEFRK